VHVDAASERRSSLRKRPMPSKANLFPIFLTDPPFLRHEDGNSAT
jgi:hypothetical protein